jgi:RimJ/RimL family protein N-acetyltransferase
MLTIRPLQEEHAERLVTILNNDGALRAELGTAEVVAIEGFLQRLRVWMEEHRGTTYAIVLDRSPIGTISISQAGMGEGTVRIGYWLASEYWNKGFGTEAFKQMLDVARGKGATTAIATIPKTSLASYKIWQKAGAMFEEGPEQFFARLELGLAG